MSFNNTITRELNTLLTAIAGADVISHKNNQKEYSIFISKLDARLRLVTLKEITTAHNNLKDWFSFMNLKYIPMIKEGIKNDYDTLTLEYSDIQLKHFINKSYKLLEIPKILAVNKLIELSGIKVKNNCMSGYIHNKTASVYIKRIFPDIIIKNKKWYLNKKDCNSLLKKYKESISLAQLHGFITPYD